MQACIKCVRSTAKMFQLQKTAVQRTLRKRRGIERILNEILYSSSKNAINGKYLYICALMDKRLYS